MTSRRHGLTSTTSPVAGQPPARGGGGSLRCPKHEPRALFRRPPKGDLDARVEYLLGHYDKWVVCGRCGRLGWYSDHPLHRLHWSYPEADETGYIRSINEEVFRKAAEWNARFPENA